MSNLEQLDHRLLLRIHEAGEILGFSRSMVYELIRTGELPFVRVGRAVRIPYDSLKEWVEKKTTRE
jgi:excisionase family DNA binding protein